jgi:hypothetical protein
MCKIIVHDWIFAKTALSPKTRKSATSLIRCMLPKVHRFYCTFSPTTLSLTLRFHQKLNLTPLFRKCTVTKTTLNFTPHLRRQRSVKLLAFGKNGEWKKILNIGSNFKKIFETVGCIMLCVHKKVITRRKKVYL